MKTTITRLLIGLSIVLTAVAFTPTGSDPACVEVEFTLHAYSGPIHITDACLTSFAHAGDSMVIEARDMVDGIFHGDFEVWP